MANFSVTLLHTNEMAVLVLRRADEDISLECNSKKQLFKIFETLLPVLPCQWQCPGSCQIDGSAVHIPYSF